MKSNNILNTIMKKDLIIPNVLLLNYREMKIDEKELLFLSYLMSYENNIAFDINRFSTHLNYTNEDIMMVIASLTEKNLINMIVKQENGKIKEYIDLSFLYNKLLSFMILEDDSNDSNDNSKIYEEIEKEFGRCLSPIECETIKHWLDSNISEDLIREALKEAVLNGVNNLKYIDKILFEWTKKGYKKAADVKKKSIPKSDEIIDLFDYDWLDTNE